MSSVAQWDDDYARLARAASQLRTTGGTIQKNLPMGSRNNQIDSIKAGLDRLNTRLNDLEKSQAISSYEGTRRNNLVTNLSRQIDSTARDNINNATSPTNNNSNNNHHQPQQLTSTTLTALNQQDEMLEELSVGMGRLKDQTRLIHDETRLHNRLLDDMENNVDMAHVGMENETRRAQKLKEDTSLWRLYIIIAVLFLLLIILILAGLS